MRDDEGEDEFEWPYKVIRKANKPVPPNGTVEQHVRAALDSLWLAIESCDDMSVVYQVR